MLAGLGLATDQPEFRLRQPGLKRKRRPEGERKRVGAPKKSATTGDDPKTAPEADLLALIVDDIRAEHPTLKGATVREILHFLKRGNPGVWLPQNAAKIIKKLDAESDSALQKVSRGRKGRYYALRKDSLDRMWLSLQRLKAGEANNQA